MVYWRLEELGDGYSVSCSLCLTTVNDACSEDLNLPLTGIAFVLVLFFLRVRTPPGSVREKLSKLDWL